MFDKLPDINLAKAQSELGHFPCFINLYVNCTLCKVLGFQKKF